MRTYDLIKKHKDLNFLFKASFISQCGSWFHTVCLITVVLNSTNSPLSLSVSILSLSLPALFFTSHIGGFVDKHNPLKIMITADLICMLLAVLYIFLYKHFYLLLILNSFYSIVISTFISSRNRYLAIKIQEENRQSVNALMGLITAITLIIGASLGGFIIYFSPEAAFLYNAISYAVSAGLLRKMTDINCNRSIVKSDKNYNSIYQTIRQIKKINFVPKIILIGITWGIVSGSYTILLPLYTKTQFNLGDLGITLFYILQGIGLLLGCSMVAILEIKNELNKRIIFFLSYLFQGIFFYVFAITTSVYLAAIALIAMRLCGGIIIPLDTTLIQNNTPSHMLGQVFALHFSVYTSAFQLSILSTGIFIEIVGVEYVTNIMAALCIIVSGLMLLTELHNKNLINHVKK